MADSTTILVTVGCSRWCFVTRDCSALQARLPRGVSETVVFKTPWATSIALFTHDLGFGLGCQRDIAERIRAKGADYLLVLKANHGRAFEAVREHSERTGFGRDSGGRPAFDAFDEDHGRLVHRRVCVGPAVKNLDPLRGWPDLSMVLAVETIRGVSGTGKIKAGIRSFLTSCGDDPAVLVRAIRRHWSVENALHWVLDVTFREDHSHIRHRTAARNFALVRKIALNLVARDRSAQTSLRGRGKKAAWDDNYMLQIIANQAHA